MGCSVVRSETVMFMCTHSSHVHHIIHTHRLIRTDGDELLLEIKWASARPSSRWKLHHAASDNTQPLPDAHTPDAFQMMLSDGELAFLDGYKSKNPDGMYSLNQDPNVTCMMSIGQVTWLCFVSTTHTSRACALRVIIICHSRDYIHVPL